VANFLLIDDDETLLMVMSRGLTRRQHSVQQATNSELAKHACQQNHFDYIVLDLKLADETGLSLISTIKQLQPHCQIVMLTAYASIATAVDAIKLGAHQYLCKPVDINQLLAAFDIDSNTCLASINDTPTSTRRLEWEHIQQVLHKNEGNISVTARELGMHRRTLQRKLQKHPVKQ